jgi:hypothetical protein
LVCLATALSCAKENKLKGENRVKTGAKVTSDANPTLNPDGTPSDNGGTNGEGGAGAPGTGADGTGGNGTGTNGTGTNGTAGTGPNGTAGTASDNVANLVNCPFTSYLNFGIFFTQGIFNSERNMQFPADATQFDAYITAVNVNDNSPTILVNGQNANLPLELPDFKAHTLIYKINISKSLKAGATRFKGPRSMPLAMKAGFRLQLWEATKLPKFVRLQSFNKQKVHYTESSISEETCYSGFGSRLITLLKASPIGTPSKSTSLTAKVMGASIFRSKEICLAACAV